MTMWVAVLAGCAACYVFKVVGYFVPGSWLEGERTNRITTLLPVALLAALIITQTFAGGDGLVIDARIGAVAVAVVLLLARANFIVVVLAGAVVAAGLRALGWG